MVRLPTESLATLAGTQRWGHWSGGVGDLSDTTFDGSN
jgi:hypothetical protein